jgi:hypothetical protein
MSERTEQRTRDTDVDTDIDTDFASVLDDGGAQSSPRQSTESKSGLRGRISQRLGGFFDPKVFALSLVLTVGLAFTAGLFIPIVPDAVTSLVAVFVGGFIIGAGSKEGHYLEVGAATLMAGALTAVLGNLVIALAGSNTGPILAIGASASGLAGILGHYFGRDLRAGLTKDV